jgi:hypothetical protein
LRDIIFRVAGLRLQVSRHLWCSGAFLVTFLACTLPLWAQEHVRVCPDTPYARFIIYETLVVLWIAIIGLVVIIRMRAAEMERTAKMGLDEEQKDPPTLE